LYPSERRDTRKGEPFEEEGSLEKAYPLGWSDSYNTVSTEGKAGSPLFIFKKETGQWRLG